MPYAYSEKSAKGRKGITLTGAEIAAIIQQGGPTFAPLHHGRARLNQEPGRIITHLNRSGVRSIRNQVVPHQQPAKKVLQQIRRHPFYHELRCPNSDCRRLHPVIPLGPFKCQCGQEFEVI